MGEWQCRRLYFPGIASGIVGVVFLSIGLVLAVQANTYDPASDFVSVSGGCVVVAVREYERPEHTEARENGKNDGLGRDLVAQRAFAAVLARGDAVVAALARVTEDALGTVAAKRVARRDPAAAVALA